MKMKMVSRSVKDTLRIGSSIAARAQKGDIICLSGELGAGKTVIVKGMAAKLGISRDKIVSPTFVLMRQYPDAKPPLYHFDLYRVSSPEDLLGLGYEEYLFGEGIAVIEWAERLKYLLPKERLDVRLSVRGENIREIDLKPTPKYASLAKKIYEDIRA